MTARRDPKIEDRIRSGRRMAVDIDLPRDKTVCLMVSEDEREGIDALAASLNRTRSAVLARIVNAFVDDFAAGGEPGLTMSLFREFRDKAKTTFLPPNRK